MISKIITKLNTLHPTLPIYGNEIMEEEVNTSPSYFLYRNTNRMKRGANGRGLYREFNLFFVTTEGLEIDIATIAETLSDGTGLYFVNSEEDYGKLMAIDKSAMMITMTFTYPVKVCFS